MTIQDLHPRFTEFQRKEGKRPKTILNYKTGFTRYINPILGGIELAELTHDDVANLKEFCSSQGRSCANRCIVQLRTMLAYAKMVNIPIGLDWRDISIPPYRVEKEVTALDQEEIGFIRSCFILETPQGLRMRTLFELLLHSGLRIAEACSLNREDIDLRKGTATVVNCKTGNRETVPLFGCENWLVKYLATRMDNNPALFYVPAYGGRGGKRMTVDTAKGYMRKLSKMYAPNLRGFHIIRKTFATELIRRKVDLKQVQFLARHASERTTLRHYVAVKKEEALDECKKVMSTAFLGTRL